jgi:metalloendopeptidase OMA1, mitochondrial
MNERNASKLTRVWRERVSRRDWIVASAPCLFGFCGCKSTPVTGRPQLRLIPSSTEMQLGEQSFQDVVSQTPPSQNMAWQETVTRVGQRIAAYANQPSFQWDFRLLASQTQNAFCLPGGKVAIYEGLIPYCQNEAGLAVVMSHEIAHAIAHHGAERMSHQAGVKGIGAMLGWAMNEATPATRELAMKAFGTGAQYGVLLPYSRRHESEADEIGLYLMAQAGYDPTEAPLFWGRFSQAAGTNTPEWASTHPSDERRAAELNSKLPVALNYYDQAANKFGKGIPLVG